MKKVLLVLTALLSYSSVFSQNADFPWADFEESTIQSRSIESERPIVPEKYRTVKLDKIALQKVLQNATIEDLNTGKNSKLQIVFPMPDGSNQVFKIYEAPVMHPDLAAKYPSIKSYAGIGVDDPTAYTRFGISESGFHAVIRSARIGSTYIDTYSKADTEHYISYFRKDFKKTDGFEFGCKTETHEQIVKDLIPEGHLQMRSGDCQIRKYRLALAANGEYSTFHGGTKALVSAELDKAVARINSVYEIDFSVTLELVPNNDDLIYLNPNTDPYSNNVNGQMLNANQTNIDDVIGNSNYDIGHIFCTGSGGLAGLGVVCRNNSKADGATGLPNPTGDPFWVEYVAHEMGHQFGANHTFNNSCGGNRSSRNAVEPGSGSTIMSYIGICAPNLGSTGDADPYFHAQSLIEVYDHITDNNDCAVKTTTSNTIPTVTTDGDRILPVSTPFVLTGSAQDDENSTLTYTWEQMDPEIGSMPPSPNNSVGPMFRYVVPDETPERYFPNLNALTKNQTPTWEVLPAVSRDMDFRFVVRDNAPGNGCVNEDNISLTFDDTAGPFLVEMPNDNSQVWLVGETRRVSWDVANTDQAPISCANVDILLSLDGGFTYPVVLVANVANNGQFDVAVPEALTDQARVMVKCSDSYFFDISNDNFSIELPPEPTFFMNVAETSAEVCSDEDVVFDIDFSTVLGFNEPVNLNLANAPSGASINFTSNSFVPPGSSQLTISDLSNVPTGVYIMQLTGTATSKTETIELELRVFNGVPRQPILATPSNGQIDVVFNENLEWDSNVGASSYLVEIASSPAFGGSIVASETVNSNVFSLSNLNLDNGTIYFWRVTPANLCGQGVVAEVFAFKTFRELCTGYQSSNLPITISGPSAGSYTDNITIDNDGNIFRTNVLVEFAHSYIGDLSATLVAPNGTRVELFDRPGFPATSFGCNGSGIRAIFDDDAALTDDEFESTCSLNGFGINGVYQPVGTLDDFSNQNKKGEWTLEFSDSADNDGGELVDWQIEVCETLEPLVIPSLVNNQVLELNQNTAKGIDATLLSAMTEGDSPEQIIYQIRKDVKQGSLQFDGSTIGVGVTFTQADIDNGDLTYQHNGGSTTTDNFVFDLYNSSGGWLANQVFNINIEFNTVSVTASQTGQILCNGANDGQITIEGIGGTTPYQYSLNGGTFQLDNVFGQLTPGEYVPTIRDANGFEQTAATITITEPTLLSAGNNVMSDVISVSVSGGTPFYEYSIDGMTFQMSNIFTDVANGSYTVTVRDENGCIAATSAVVAVNSLGVFATLLNDISCIDENDARIKVTVAGGQAPYIFSLDGLSGVPGISGQPECHTFENIWAGSHNVTVFDAQGFQIMTNQVVVTNPAPIVATISVVDDVLTIDASGGTGTLRYSLNGQAFQTNNVFTDLPNSNYIIGIKDDNGCLLTENASVAVNRVTISTALIQDNVCFNENIGIIEATGAGGVEPYQYRLNNGTFQMNNRFEGLAPGNYTVTTQDAEGFLQTSTNINISQPVQITASIVASGYDIIVTANGGASPLQYSLDGQVYQGSNIFRNNLSGDYDIYIKDANGCIIIDNATIDIAALGLMAAITSPVKCNGESNGVVTLTPSGGFGPYKYSMDGNIYDVSNIFSGLGAGSYTFYIKDAGDFVEKIDIELAEPSVLLLGSPILLNESMTFNATGGTLPLEYSFDGSSFSSDNSISDIVVGQDYIVAVRDANGCVKTGTFSISVVQIDYEVRVDCDGIEGADLEINAMGGAQPYRYSLDSIFFQDQNIFEGIGPGDHVVYIVDAAGYGYSFVIENIPSYPLNISANVNNNEVTVMATDGVTPYSFQVDNDAFTFTSIFSNLSDGDHTFTVRDANGCQVSIVENINSSSVIALDNQLVFEINPNPSSGLLTLKMEQATNHAMIARVFDVAGRLIYEEKFMKYSRFLEKNFNLQLQPGNYLMVIEDGDFSGRKQLIIIK